MSKTLKEPPAEDCATVWFARLEQAKETNDFESAADAVRELRRLGVTVKFDAAQRRAIRQDQDRADAERAGRESSHWP